MSLAPPNHHWGYRKGQWLYVFNLLAKIAGPGDWCLDREGGLLYFWPPAPIAQGEAVATILQVPLVTLKDCSYVTLQGLTLEATRGVGVTVTGGTHNRVIGCTLRNLGGHAVIVEGGVANGVVDCEISGTGNGGISLMGGDRKTLTPAGHDTENNHIHHYSTWNRICNPAISLDGVGNRASHNLIHDAPHQAIAFGGNDHVIEFNDICNVCAESNDAEAIYNGRDWTQRGTEIRYNFLHDIRGLNGRGAHRNAEFQVKWEAILREWSVRWGKRVVGWWFDGCYWPDAMYRFSDPPNFATFAAAARAGNPDAIVAFNNDGGVLRLSEHEDYTAGETTKPEERECRGRWVDGAHWHILTYLGPRWGAGPPRFSDEQVIALTRKLVASSGAVTWDVPIQADGLIPGEFVKQLKALSDGLRRTSSLPSPPP
jgi:hypothetical protein